MATAPLAAAYKTVEAGGEAKKVSSLKDRSGSLATIYRD
jgi:hypothetical protein